MLSAAKTGDVSVSPYPWTTDIPKSLNPCATFGSSPDAPLITERNFPPNLSTICLNNFERISIPNLSKNLLNDNPNFTFLVCPVFSISCHIFL